MNDHGGGDIPQAVKEKIEKMTNLLKSAQLAISTLKAENEKLKKENESLQDKVKTLEKEKKITEKDEVKPPSVSMPTTSPKVVMKKAPLEQK